jgi:hypothetical protein
MVMYKCKCDYETHDITKIKRHLIRKRTCIPNISMGDITITEPMLKNPVNLSELTAEEKRKRRLEQKIAVNTKHKMVGNMSIEQFAKYTYNGLKINSKRRNHNMVLILDDIINILENNQTYTVVDTILGDLEFPIIASNGFHNTASFDRIDDKIGYIKGNIEIRPRFLNNTKKLTTNMICGLISLRQEKQNEEELKNIANDINNFDSNIFFYKLATSIISNSKSAKKKNKKFEFSGNRECAIFLIKKYIDQGGRCAYTNAPIYPETKHLYKISPERLDPMKGYLRENIVLIIVGLNGPPPGQFCNKHLLEEEKIIALKHGIFNQKYWDSCTNITLEITEKCTEVREYGKQILLENLTDNIKAILGY